ncbi:hypothetical protein HY643_01135 [Candidatus Woesearchaeota archaeon]|nr:hypothetical protein [Candidatus Woesearchaeota archaeon]
MNKNFKHIGTALGLTASLGAAGCAGKKPITQPNAYKEKVAKLVEGYMQDDKINGVKAIHFIPYGNPDSFRVAVLRMVDLDKDGIDDLAIAIGHHNQQIDPIAVMLGAEHFEVLLADVTANGYGKVDEVIYNAGGRLMNDFRDVEAEKMPTVNALYQKIIDGVAGTEKKEGSTDLDQLIDILKSGMQQKNPDQNPINQHPDSQKRLI